MTEVKKAKTKSISREELEEMFARQKEDIDKRIDEKCDSCSHHECECPERIKALDESTDRRMDIIDRNVETVQGNVEKAYDVLSAENEDLRSEVERLSEEGDRTYRTMEWFAMIAGIAGVLCMVIVGLVVTGNL